MPIQLLPDKVSGRNAVYMVDGNIGRKGKFGGVATASSSSGERVTIKRVDKHIDEVLAVVERLALIDRPDIAPVVDVAQQDGALFIVRKMIEGTDIKSIFADKKVYGKIDEDNWIKIGLAVLDALSALHSAGIVHRDIKPSNIVLRHSPGQDLIHADFSAISIIDFEQSSVVGSQTARTAFSLIYSPPEMVLKHSDLVGPQADLFALATTIYHLVMGKTPYNDCNPEVLINLQLTYPFQKPGRMTQQLFDVLAHAAYKQAFRLPPRRLSADEIADTLRRGVEGRYSSADEMRAALASVDHALLPASWWQKVFN
ncbi:MAG: protein kinase [Bacteroidales bacterium]|nr:protein kinase [Bacteroidales bacterium]